MTGRSERVFSQGQNPAILSASSGTAEGAAEEVRLSCRMGEKHTSGPEEAAEKGRKSDSIGGRAQQGLKPGIDFKALAARLKVVPCYKAIDLCGTEECFRKL